MQSITHREFKTWIAWLDDQWNKPSKSDYYLMQIAGYVSHVLSKKSWKLDTYKVNFQVGDQKQSKDDIGRKTEAAKARWRARAGLSREN